MPFLRPALLPLLMAAAGCPALPGGILERPADAFGGGYEVAHSTPIWIIDRQGRIRVTMDADVLPSEIAGNVRALRSR